MNAAAPSSNQGDKTVGEVVDTRRVSTNSSCDYRQTFWHANEMGDSISTLTRRARRQKKKKTILTLQVFFFFNEPKFSFYRKSVSHCNVESFYQSLRHNTLIVIQSSCGATWNSRLFFPLIVLFIYFFFCSFTVFLRQLVCADNMGIYCARHSHCKFRLFAREDS